VKDKPKLPARKGPKPKTTATIPHYQVDQIAPVKLQEALWQRMNTLSGIKTGPSRISVPGARAVFVTDGHNHKSCERCMIDGEFAHLHPQDDGSLHMTLPDNIRQSAMAQGWAEPHVLVGSDKVPETVVMVYGPRDDGELEIVWSLVTASHAFAMVGSSG
jgi:hypothetical protein